MTFWDDLGDPLQLSTYLTDYLYRVSFWRYRPLKLPLSCEVAHMRFEIAVTSEHVADFG